MRLIDTKPSHVITYTDRPKTRTSVGDRHKPAPPPKPKEPEPEQE